MKLIEEIFKKYKLKEESLLNYGFIFNNGIYSYNKLIYNNTFELRLTIINKITRMNRIITNKSKSNSKERGKDD